MLNKAGLLDDAELARLLAALDDLAAGLPDRQVPARGDRRGRAHRAGAGPARTGRHARRQAAGRPQPQRPGRHRPAAVPARSRPAHRVRLAELQAALMGQAERHLDTPAPGMTHLQHAQPVLLAHQLLAHVQAFARDAGRLAGLGQARRRLPARVRRAGRLVAAAGSRRRSPPSSASTRAAANSMDAVSDRDFAAEFCFAAALLGVHLSRLGEEIVLWSSHEFGWAEIDDAYATGSSIMPQKKNPDVAELARGKAGRLIGGLTGLLTTLKGLPLTYNRDLQEDKEPVFDAVDTLLLVLPAMAGPGQLPCDSMRNGWPRGCRRPRARHRPGRTAGPARGPVPRGA